MNGKIELSHPVFPTPDMGRTADYYVSVLGFRRVDYLESEQQHICLYRDSVEIILTQASRPVISNHRLYSYGYDAYFITEDGVALQNEFASHGARIIRPVQTTDYQNTEFVLEDIDGRWLAFGIKQKTQTVIRSKNGEGGNQ